MNKPGTLDRIICKMKPACSHAGSAVRNANGFTLLEIMIALAIIGITVTVVLHTVNYHADVMYSNITTTRMYQLAKEKIYELESVPKSSEGVIGDSGFTYENIVNAPDDSEYIELITVLKGHGKEVTLNEIILRKEF